MKAAVLLLWTGCLASIALSVAHFAWTATVQERLLVLAVAVLAAGNLRFRS